MKNKIILIISFLLIGSPYTKPQDSLRIGIGISLNPNIVFSTNESQNYSLTNPGSFYLIFNLSHFRLESEFGYYSYSIEYNENQGSSESDYSILKTGLGIVYVYSMESSFKIYAGPRFGWIFRSSKYIYTGMQEDKTTELDFLYGICTGGEYLFSEHFSIGGEVQLNYVSFGEPEYTPARYSSSSRSAGQTGTNSAMFFRWFF